MASKVSYPNSSAPAAPAGVAQITYTNAAAAGVPPSDPNDRIGAAPTTARTATAEGPRTAQPGEFVPNAMPAAPIDLLDGQAPTAEETSFADRVLELKRRLVEALAGESSPEVAFVALMSAACTLGDYGDTDDELRPRLEATLRDYARLNHEQAPIT